jgi:glutamine synthetase
MSFARSNEGKIRAEYVWIGGGEPGGDLRSKTRTLDFHPTSPSDLPDWNYDGSSTNQASGHDSDVIIKPRAIFRDPFRGVNDILVLCDTYYHDGRPLPTNTRAPAQKIFERGLDQEPWFGIEQEYIMFTLDKRPLGFPSNGGFPEPQGPYYCSVGANHAFGRQIVEEHYEACLLAGVMICGSNAEVCCGQWEFQVGPCTGIDMGDHMWVARYILSRVAEKHGVVINYDPKPILGDWNGSGAHTNFSTKAMREEGGITHIKEACEKLGKKHKEHIEVYGFGNERRLTGKHETQSMHKFSYGVADRGSSIRIPRQTALDGKGYLEDRRPASNVDPYVVISKIFETCCDNM